MEFLSFSPTLSVNDTEKHRLPVEKPSSSVAHKNNLYQRWTELRSAECCIVASLQQFVDVSLCCISLRHDDMKFIAASFFSLQPLMRSSKEKKAKEKRSHYSVIDWAKRIKRQLMENIIKCSYPKMTGQNDRPDESLTGQVHDQAGHCPLTGRYFEPWSLNRKFFYTNILGIFSSSFLRFCSKFSMKIIFYRYQWTPTRQSFLVFVCTTASFIAQMSCSEYVPKQNAILAPVTKQWIAKDTPSYGRQSKLAKSAVHWFGKY